MKKTIVAILACFALCPALQSMALDFETRTIDGKTYYIYTVREKDTVDGLSSKLGMTRADILRFNPSAADGLTPGQWLIFPAGEYEASDTKDDKAGEVEAKSPDFIIYTVKDHETIFGIAHRFHTSADQLVKINPQAASGVRRDMTLKIPVNNTATASAEKISAPVEPALTTPNVAPSAPVAETKTETLDAVAETKAETPSAVSETPATPTAPEVESPVAETVTPVAPVADPIAQSDSIYISIALPLMSKSEKVSKSANNFNEFYRGFLAGAQSIAEADLNSMSQPAPVSISLIDTSITPLSAGDLKGASIVIVGEEAADIKRAERFADEDAIIFNLFNLKGEEYLYNPNVFHAHVTQNQMYESAVAYVLEKYHGYTPVVLNREGSKGEKQGFIEELKNVTTGAGGNVIEINYSGKLTEEDLSELSPYENYVFIPTSGSLADFNSFAHLLKSMRKDEANPDRLAVFGYPDWIAFRGEPRNLLSHLQASYYSRFADIEGNVDAANVLNDYTTWYGTNASEGIPNQALLGYDTARYIINGLRRSHTAKDLMQSGVLFEGVQYGIRPAKVPGEASGYINEAVYIITFNKDGSTQSIIK